MPAENKNETVDEVKEALGKISGEIKEAGEKALAEAKKGIELGNEQKGRIDEMLVKQGELIARLDEVEQKAARRGRDGQREEKSIGRQFVESDKFKAFADAKGKRSMHMDFKTVTSITSTTTGTGAAGDLILPDRQAGILPMPTRRMTVRDLITPGRTSSSTIEYLKETGFQNLAAVVAEGGTKPQSDIAFDLLNTPVVTIAHWVKASNQILADAPMLESYIDGRLRYGLEYVEEAQLLNGSGSGGNLNGIYTQATAYSAPAGGYGGGFYEDGSTVIAAQALDILRLAMLQAQLAEFPATGIVLNPIQWAAIETLKDSNGRYIIGDPKNDLSPRLWTLPVVATQAMTTDKFLVGAFKLGAQVFDREDANVQISTEDGDNFIKNMVTIRAEERLGLAVYRPEAFIKGDLGFVA